jgi:hypothetical protein
VAGGVANFTNYNAAYGAVGGVIVLLLWFYLSGVALLAGAELNAEIEHASSYGKLPGRKNAAGKRLLGRRAKRAFEHRRETAPSPNMLPPLRDVSAVLFDVDGTLVESNRAHAEAWAQALSGWIQWRRRADTAADRHGRRLSCCRRAGIRGLAEGRAGR